MGSFTFTSPEGKSYTVNGPDGATQDQAWGILQQQLGQPPAAAAQPATDPNATLASGAGHGIMGAAGNAAQTVAGAMGAPDLGQAAQTFFRTMGGAAPATTSGQVGDFAGRVALNTPLAGVESFAPVAAGVAGSEGVKDAGGGPVGQLLASVLGGGLAGGAGGGLRGAIESQATTPPPDSREAAVAAIRGAGIPMNVAEATGNKLARHVDRASQMLSTGAEQFAQKQQQAFNGVVLDSIGAPGAKTGAQVLKALPTAKASIGTGMDEIEARSGAAFDTQLAGDIQAIQRNLSRQTAESNQGPLLNNLQDMISAARDNNGTIPGAVVRNIRANLLDLSSQQQPGASKALEALQDAVTRNSSPADVAAYTKLRQQYRALKQIQDAVDPASGNITPLRLMQILGQAKNDNQTLYAKGDQRLVQLARNAVTALPDRLGNSGTSERFIPTLTFLEALKDARPVQAATKLGLGILGGGLGARALRNQKVVDALTSDKLSDTLSGIRGDLLPGAGYGAYGAAASSADQFLRQLDQIEQLRRNAQTGNSSGNSKGSPAVVTGSSVVGAGP